ncbi:MAG TPA: hypothetical protein VF713_02615 [Thermoanaerobaculia bacterium]
MNNIEIRGERRAEWDEILTADALAFVADLHRRFNLRREELPASREVRKLRIDPGELPDFLPETKAIPEG